MRKLKYSKYKKSKNYNSEIYQTYLKKYKSQEVMAHKKGLEMKSEILSPTKVINRVNKGLSEKDIAKSQVRKTKYNYYIKDEDVNYQTYLKKLENKVKFGQKYNEKFEVDPYNEKEYSTNMLGAKNTLKKLKKHRKLKPSQSEILNTMLNQQIAKDYDDTFTYSRKYALAQLNHLRDYDPSITINDIMYRSEKFRNASKLRDADFKRTSQERLEQLFSQKREAKTNGEKQEGINIQAEIDEIYSTFYGS